MRMLIASEHKRLFLSVIAPADGITAATEENGNFGTSPFLEQL
jgi:hypothetical protein